MRSGLFWKLFLLQLLAVTAVLAGALAVSRAYSLRGFAELLELRERERVEQLAERLAEVYEDGGDLTRAWESVPALRDRARRRPPPPPEAGPHGHARLVMRHVPPPLQLQDAHGNYLRGERDMPPEGLLRVPIEADDEIVGYIAWPKAPRHPEQQEFAHKQLMHIVRIAPIALLVAAVFAALITALIVRPIRQLSGGTAALARREFGTRLPEDRRDELGALATDFNRLAAALEGYDMRQKQWLADLSHELRTPLTVLRGELEAVIDGLRPADAGSLRSLRQEVGRLEALIEDLRLVALADSGGLRLNMSTTDVGTLVQQAAARFRERMAARGFELKIEAEPNLLAQLDAQRFEQVLANLLENALSHAAPPGPIGVAARREGTQVLVAVTDAGPGVPTDALPRLFDRLYRVESARSRAGGGAGLGLSICKSIVEAHGGTIVAQASAQNGLEIRITLPA